MKQKDFTIYLDNEARENVKFFAAHALQGLISATTWISETKAESGADKLNVNAAPQPLIAAQAFDIAEAMLAEYVARVAAAVQFEEQQKAANAPAAAPTATDEADLEAPAIH